MIVITHGRNSRWFLKAGGLFIQVMFRTCFIVLVEQIRCVFGDKMMNIYQIWFYLVQSSRVHSME